MSASERRKFLKDFTAKSPFTSVVTRQPAPFYDGIDVDLDGPKEVVFYSGPDPDLQPDTTAVTKTERAVVAVGSGVQLLACLPK